MANHEPPADEQLRQVAAGLAGLRVRGAGEVTVAVNGRSMGAGLAPSCEVRVVPLEGTPRPGDVLLVQQGAELVAHRVVAVGRALPVSLVTKGDACFHADHPSSADDVIGRVVEVVRGEQRFVPWHWRPPVSRGIALLSRLEGALWPHFSYPLRVIHRAWRPLLHGRRPSQRGKSTDG